jgi:hypothetical protein
MRNQIKWSDALSFMEFTKWNQNLWVTGAPQPTRLFTKITKMVKIQSFVYSLQEGQRLSIFTCEYWITLNRLETLLCLKRRNESMVPRLRRKNPFTNSRFEIAVDQS